MRHSILFLWLLLPFNFLLAQSVLPEVLSAAGNRFEIDSFSVEWTLGEPATATFVTPNTTLTQGFHQPEYYLMTDIIEKPDQKLGEITVYPNPTDGQVYADIKMKASNLLKIQLVSANGKVLINFEQNVQNEILEFDFSQYPAGSYWLNFSNPNSPQPSSFLIQKITKQ